MEQSWTQLNRQKLPASQASVIVIIVIMAFWRHDRNLLLVYVRFLVTLNNFEVRADRFGAKCASCDKSGCSFIWKVSKNDPAGAPRAQRVPK